MPERLHIRVRGRSMEPSLSDGQAVVVRLSDGGAARVGDVVLALCDGTTVLHRVIGRGRDGIRMQGDALRSPDPHVPVARILGIAELPRRPLFAALRGLRETMRARVRCLDRRRHPPART